MRERCKNKRQRATQDERETAMTVDERERGMTDERARATTDERARATMDERARATTRERARATTRDRQRSVRSRRESAQDDSRTSATRARQERECAGVGLRSLLGWWGVRAAGLRSAPTIGCSIMSTHLARARCAARRAFRSAFCFCSRRSAAVSGRSARGMVLAGTVPYTCLCKLSVQEETLKL